MPRVNFFKAKVLFKKISSLFVSLTTGIKKSTEKRLQQLLRFSCTLKKKSNSSRGRRNVVPWLCCAAVLTLKNLYGQYFQTEMLLCAGKVAAFQGICYIAFSVLPVFSNFIKGPESELLAGVSHFFHWDQPQVRIFRICKPLV